MLIDPKAPLDTIPEYMVKQPSNYLISGSFLYNTVHLISFICTMILLSVFLPRVLPIRMDYPKHSQKYSGDYLWILLWWLNQLKKLHAHKQHCQHHHDNGTSKLDDCNLVNIAAANSMVLNGNRRLSSITGYLGDSMGVSTKAGEFI
jgi:hypothetical protein